MDDEYRTPGQLIAEILEARDWTKRVLAIVLGVDETGLNKIIAGKRKIDAELALALGDVLGVRPERLLDLQKSYDLAQARIVARPDPGRAARAQLYGALPIAEMIKRRWINAEDIKRVHEVERDVARFFGVEEAAQIPILPHAAKKTDVGSATTPVQLAWLYRVRQIAAEMVVPRYTPDSGRKAVHQLSGLLSAPEEARHVPRIMAEAGIRFVIVESLPGAKIDGACLWLNDASPVVGMSLRFDRIDNFWFVLRHELEHVVRGHGKATAVIDCELEGDRAGTGDDVSQDERDANTAASSFCVPQKDLDSFVARKQPFFSERDVLGFAAKRHLHPGLVAGQLRHRLKRWDLFAKHLVKIRHAVTPGAMVDGWGDVAPVQQDGVHR